MISHPGVTKSSIRRHYDLLSPFYRLLWGRHIHHGLWDEADGTFEPSPAEPSPAELSPAELSPAAAQLRLTEALAGLAGIRGGEAVLDVGCGLGGSAVHLAKARGCRVTGVTLSGVQRAWASLSARRHGVGGRTRFLRADAERVEFDAGSFDVLWSVECTEHLFDKAGFFRRAAGWLRPGGRVAVCAWLAGDEPLSEGQRRTAEAVCEGMFCPSLGTAADYEGWLHGAGLVDVEVRDWTGRVARTWEVCLGRVRRTGAGRLAPLFGREAALFVSRFETMIAAYRTGALRYAALTGRRP